MSQSAFVLSSFLFFFLGTPLDATSNPIRGFFISYDQVCIISNVDSKPTEDFVEHTFRQKEWINAQSRQFADRDNSYLRIPSKSNLDKAPKRDLNPMFAERYPSNSRSGLNSVAFHLYSIWLFTFSDLKTIVGPKTIFGTLSAIRASVFHIHGSPVPLHVVSRVPLVALWTWINLLPFTINNQRQPAAVQEDTLNKPWRPLPSGRLTPVQAKRLMLVLYPVALLTSSFLTGGTRQSTALIALGYWYNDLKGGDSSPITRNFINACGFISYISGAMEVALGTHIKTPFTSTLLPQWFLIIGAIVFTTVHTQDMYDQAGDSLRSRRTVPLVIGDAASRWTIAVPMLVWSTLVPWYWRVSVYGYIVPVVMGLSVAYRTLMKRSVENDERTFRIWNAWLVTLYLLPLFY